MDKDKNQTSAALLEQLVYIDNFINSGTDSSVGDRTPNLDMEGQLLIDLAAFADDSFIFPDEDKHEGPSGDQHQSNGRHGRNGAFEDGVGGRGGGENPIGFGQNSQNQNGQSGHRKETHNSHSIGQNHTHNHSPSLGLDFPGLPLDISPVNYDSGAGAGGRAGIGELDLSRLPKFPVPPGAKSSLESAGMSTNQIDLLAALIAQHQQSTRDRGSHGQAVAPGGLVNGAAAGGRGGFSDADLPTGMPTSLAPGLTSGLGTDSPHVRQSPVRQHNLLSDESSVKSETTSMFETPTLQALLFPEDSASEADKRRRNTAASARFRNKKKVKEKQMEGRISDLNQTVKQFENRIQQLELENRVLRTLIIEKGTERSDQEVQMLKERARSGI